MGGGLLAGGAAVGAGGELGGALAGGVGRPAAAVVGAHGGVLGAAVAVAVGADLHGADPHDGVEVIAGRHRGRFLSAQVSWAAMASASWDGTPRRARRVSVSIGDPVRAWWSSATLRAWSTRATGTAGTAGAAGAAGSGAGGSAAGSAGVSSASVTATGRVSGSGEATGSGAVAGTSGAGWAVAEWARSVPPMKARAGQAATRMRSQAGTCWRSRSPAVATLAPSEATSAIRNQHQASRDGPSLRSRRQEATKSRSTEIG